MFGNLFKRYLTLNILYLNFSHLVWDEIEFSTLYGFSSASSALNYNSKILMIKVCSTNGIALSKEPNQIQYSTVYNIDLLLIQSACIGFMNFMSGMFVNKLMLINERKFWIKNLLKGFSKIMIII